MVWNGSRLGVLEVCLLDLVGSVEGIGAMQLWEIENAC
jgi:hypothetical protein